MLLTEESEVKAHWAGYFERLYQADPPAVELDVRGVTIMQILFKFQVNRMKFEDFRKFGSN